MKKLFLLPIFLIIGIAENYSQGWQWKDSTLDSKILKDANDDLYVFSNNSPNFTIKKLDVNGAILWTRTATGNAVITAYKIDGNNNLVLLGNITSSTTIGVFTLIPKGQQSFFILKLSPNSSVLSANVYGGPKKTFANDLFINTNGEYLIGGGFTGTFDMNGDSITSDTLQNLFIVKTDNNQNVLWFEKSTLYTNSGEAWVDEVVETTSGKIYATITFLNGLAEYKGYQFTSDGQYLLQLNNSRNITWANYLGYPPQSSTLTTDMQTNGDTLYMKEYYAWHNASASVFMWTDLGIKTSISYSNTYTLGYSVSNGKIYYAFLAANDPWAPTFDYRKIGSLTLGLSEQGQSADSMVTLQGSYSEVQYINPTSLYIGGYGMSAPFAGKFTMSTVNSVAENNNESDQFQIFPNPSSGKFTVESSDPSTPLRVTHIEIINVLGEKIYTSEVNSEKTKIDLSSQSQGIYFIEIISEGKIETRKIVLN